MKYVANTNAGTGHEEIRAADHLEVILDEALMGTYPSSDPIAISIAPAPARKLRSNPRRSTMTRPAQALQTPTDLSRNSMKNVAATLNRVLADHFALYFKTKNFHWHVSGPHFRDYHLLFDDQAAQILATVDAVAERVRKTGNTTLRSIGDVTRHQTIQDNDGAFVSAAAMLAELREDNLKLVAALRQAKEVVDAAKDNATSGILDDWTDEAEGRAWVLFEASRDSVPPRPMQSETVSLQE